MELIFKDEYFRLVENGEKTTTIKKGVRIPESRELILKPLLDDKKNYEYDEDYFINAELIRLEFKALYDLSNQDAELDGFQDKRELEEVLYKIYPDIDEETIFTIIEFEI